MEFNEKVTFILYAYEMFFESIVYKDIFLVNLKINYFVPISTNKKSYHKKNRQSKVLIFLLPM